MLAALLTAFFFALSAIFGARAARKVGPVNANFIRLCLAGLILAMYAFTLGKGLAGPGLPIFLISGMIGFGLGDIALFHAYERLGSRRTILLAQCAAVPFAAFTEWVWLGTVILPAQLLWILVILGGICLAVRPTVGQTMAPRMLWTGVGFGLLAALGQGWGAVLSRKAVALNVDAGIHLDGLTSSFQRIIAGIVVAFVFFVWFRWKKRPLAASALARLERKDWGRAAFCCVGNGLAGPVLGVGCYQWALSQAPSGVVLAIVATTPVLALPLVWVLKEDKPEPFAIAGSILATCGVAGLLFGSIG